MHYEFLAQIHYFKNKKILRVLTPIVLCKYVTMVPPRHNDEYDIVYQKVMIRTYK